jgi:transcriptional regulator GlxA family with amidase domain
MHRRMIWILVAALVAVGCAGSGAVSRGGTKPEAAPLAPVPAGEQARTIAAMRPPRRARPVIAVIGQNEGTETTDYLIPYGVLAASGAAEVFALATEARALKLTPALTIAPQATTAEFDARYPDGADYVIVPKIQDSADPKVVGWIQAQAAKGSLIVGICSGAKTLSAAGFLRGRAATGHWYDIEGLQKENPTMRWVRDRRYVADRGVVTTTGVSASLPVSLALVEAIAGYDRAAELAAELGVSSWDARHDSDAFRLDRRTIRTARVSKLAFWDRDTYGVPVAEGVDEIALAFTADAWSRTYRSQALAVAEHRGSLQTRRGIRLLPDAVSGGKELDVMLPSPASVEPAKALGAALEGIEARYGANTAAFVALQLEYPRQPAPKESRLIGLLEAPGDLPIP